MNGGLPHLIRSQLRQSSIDHSMSGYRAEAESTSDRVETIDTTATTDITTSNASNPMLHHALKYADNGWAIFPLYGVTQGECQCGMKCSSPGKHPRTPNGLNDATTEIEIIESWWTKWPESNIGIRTGRISDLWVLDIDNKKSIQVGNRLVGQGQYSLMELENELGTLPETRYVETGGGGRHVYFSFVDGCGGNRANIRNGLDIRGEGGYVVAPPSVHISGHLYRWENEDILPGVPPGRLVEFAQNDRVSADSIGLDEKVGEGGRNQFLHDLGATYRREQGYVDWQLYGLLNAHNHNQCQPPLADAEVWTIARSVARYEYVPRLDLSQWDGGDAPDIPEGGDLATSLEDFIHNPPIAPNPLVHGIIDVGTGVLIGGQANVGKSWLVMDLAVAIASGQSWLDKHKTESGPILMIDEEGTPYGQYERFKMLLDGRNVSSVGMPLYLAIGVGIRLDSDVGITRIRRMLERYRPRLVVLDSLVRLHAGDENNAQKMAQFFATTKDLMRTYETTFLFTHHVRKPSLESTDPGDLLRGTTEIRAWPDTIFVAVPGSDNQEVILHHVKARYGPRSNPFRVRMQIDDTDKTARLAHSGEYEAEGRSAVATQDRVLKVIIDLAEQDELATAEAIAMNVEKSTRVVKDYLRQLVRAGAVDALEGTYGPVYRIKGA
jgi:hypothetical protein